MKLSEIGILAEIGRSKLESDLESEKSRSDFNERLLKQMHASIQVCEMVISNLSQEIHDLKRDLDIARDAQNCKVSKCSEITTADIATAPGSYDQAYVDTIKDLLNEIKTKHNNANQH